jgi:hypothetical protein
MVASPRLRLVCATILPVALVAIAFACISAPLARADGDPASDVLLAANVFYPYSPAVSGALERRLTAATAAAAKAGAPIKIALIASPTDLGVIPALFGHPQEYAAYLDQEISFNTRAPLLVVMPVGYGSKGLPPAAAAVVPGLARPAGRSGDALAAAALTAVGRIATAEGHPLGAIIAAPVGGGSSGSGAIVGLLVAAVIAVTAALALIALRRRRARA